MFGHQYFKYYDPRVAELVTAFGRDTLAKMQAIAIGLGFIILYGDTDSLFVNNLNSIKDARKFIEDCKLKLGVDVGHETTFSKLILVGKKHYSLAYFQILAENLSLRGSEGIKSDRPEYAEILRERHLHPNAVFFTHLHPDHTSGVADLPADVDYVFGRQEAGFLARVAVGSHFSGKPRLKTLDYAGVAAHAAAGSGPRSAGRWIAVGDLHARPHARSHVVPGERQSADASGRRREPFRMGIRAGRRSSRLHERRSRARRRKSDRAPPVCRSLSAGPHRVRARDWRVRSTRLHGGLLFRRLGWALF